MDPKDFGACFPFRGLHCPSFFGIAESVAPLIEIECDDADERDFLGYTPLAWAAHNGHVGVMEILLGREEVNPDEPDNEGQTLFSHAASHGHEGAVKTLLGLEDVNPDKPDHFAKHRPLSFATRCGHSKEAALLPSRKTAISPTI